jgi:hypothetical protein
MMTGETPPMLWGIRVIKPRAWRVGAFASCERVASAIKSRGLGAFCKAVITP